MSFITEDVLWIEPEVGEELIVPSPHLMHDKFTEYKYSKIIEQLKSFQESVKMEIIQQGNPELARKTKQFICSSCGCIFRADKSEYEYAGSQYNVIYWKHRCPTCGLWIYVED